MKLISEQPSDEVLLSATLEHLENALAFVMEMESKEGQALAHFLHAAMVYGVSIEEPDEDAD